MLTDTARGNYSNKFQVLEQERVNRMKDVSADHARQVAIRDRANKLSAETNRRRKALETKKKLEAQKEAKRRQEVLDERRQRQRDATNRYQRANKSNRRNHERNNSAKAYSGVPLQDGVLMARGYRLESPRSYGSGTPSLDDVLQMVTAPTSLSLKYGQGYHNYQHNGMVPASTYPTTSQYNGSYLDSNSNITPVSETKGYTKPTHGALNHAATPSRVDSRTSLFEQEIAQQQQQLIAQQQRTLQEFSQAIQNETGAGTSEGGLHRSGSLSSVDSLEEQKDQQRGKHEHSSNHPANPHQVVSTAGNYGVSSDHNNRNFVANNAQDAGFNYSLHHNNVLLRGSYEITHDGPQPTSTSNVHSTTSAVSSGVGTSHTVTTSTAPHLGYNASGAGHRAAKEDSYGQEQSAASQAWSTSKVTKPPVQSHASAPTANAGQRSRPYSARTTATAVTVAPAVSYPVKTQEPHIQQPVGAMSPSVLAMNEAIEGHIARLANPVEDCTASPVSGVSRQELLQPSEEEVSQVPSPKSILKRHKTDTPTKDKKSKGLAAAIMRDSLEMGKLSGIKSQKKSVRWTDMYYSDDESVDTQGTTDTTPAHRKPRIVSGVNARTVQERLGGKETNPTGTPPRPKSGTTNSTKDRSSMQMKNNQYANGGDLRINQSEKEKVAAKAAHLAQNGIRLDKTPTDDEINWLWDKVRTCLNTKDEGPDGKALSQTSSTRQSTSASQYSDPRITANLRVAPPANKPRFSTYNDTLRRHVIAPRKATNADPAGHPQQSAAFQQRRQHVRSASASRAMGQRKPEGSQQAPGRHMAVQQPQDVSESLAAFQQAEQLVQQNADDADIVAVIEQQRQYPHMHHDQKAHPSALSMEEAKILESLDRLNARLKTVTSEMNGSFNPIYPAMPPRPPTHGTGFRGHRPMSSRPGAGGGVGNAARPSLRVRAHSADRSNVRIGQPR